MLCALLDCTVHTYVGLGSCKHRYTGIHNKHNRIIIKEVFMYVRTYAVNALPLRWIALRSPC